MLAFLAIYIMILGMSVASAMLYKKGSSWKDKISSCARFYVIYYFVICQFRTVAGNGAQYLSSSFADKAIRAYIKVGILGVAAFAAIWLFTKFTKGKGENYLNKVVAIFSSLYLLYTVLIDLPKLSVIVVFGVIAILLGVILAALEIKGMLPWLFKQDKSIKKRYAELGVVVLLFCCLFLLTGPVELYAYNTSGFVFSLGDFFPYMLIYIGLMLLPIVIVVSDGLPDSMFSLIKNSIFFYCVCSYVQQMFLNGDMSKMEGVAQQWDMAATISNLLIWIVLIGLLGILFYKTRKGNVIMTYVSAFIGAVQLITLITVIITSSVSGVEGQQLTEDKVFHLSPNENVVVFILDAYDTQMLDMVLKNDGAYLEPLHDFTYYDNMASRYTATDGSLPYLLTGRIAEEEESYEDIYNKSTFLKDIKESGYDINILTETNYVEPFEENIVDNMSEDSYCVLDYEKTVSQMSKCVRYRSTPFIAKPYYYYENYDLTNVIHDTNVYLFGTDADFYADLNQNGIYIDESMENTMQIYHLYGAHSPYYLTEDASLDYSSNPIAQWKGCLKIVYDYLEQLKEKELYDKTSVIIMADHGLNRSQRLAMDEWNISVTEDSNPIFFIKRADQKQEQLEIDSRAVSHDDFFATVMKLIKADADQYGKAVWEK